MAVQTIQVRQNLVENLSQVKLLYTDLRGKKEKKTQTRSLGKQKWCKTEVGNYLCGYHGSDFSH